MHSTKTSAWNRMEFATLFDKQRRAVKLGQHRERLILTQRAIDNSTPRCFKQYKLNHEKHKKHKEKEMRIDQQRRRRLSMVSPYHKHTQLPTSSPTSSLQDTLQIHSNHRIVLNFNAAINHRAKSAQSTSISHSLSPTNSSIMSGMPYSCNSWSGIRHHNTKKRRQRSNTSKMRQKKIQRENVKLKKRLSEIQPSNYLNTIQKHWALHSHIKKNIQRNKRQSSNCPDVIYSRNYRKLRKTSHTKQNRLHKSHSMPSVMHCSNNNKENCLNKKHSHKLPKIAKKK
eukprot:935011_1